MIVAVVLKGRKFRKMYRFKDPEKLRQFCQNAKVKFPELELHLVSCTKRIPPPKDFVPRKFRKMWCPYCGKIREFKFSNRLGLHRCEICRISEADFFIKKYNLMWGKVFATAKKKSKKEKIDEFKVRRRVSPK